MDNTDKIIKQILKQNIEIPKSFDTKIKEIFKSKKIKFKIIFSQLVTACVCLIATTGIVFAGYTAYEKVWIEPKKYESYEEYEQDYMNSIKDNLEVTNEDKEKIISEEQAREKALEFLKKIGYENEKIVKTELNKNDILESKLIYSMKTNIDADSGFYITINGETGKVESFMDLDFFKTKVEQDKITEGEAEEYVKEIYNLFDLKEGEYKAKEIKQIPFYYKNIPTDIWNATYCKVYDGAFNQFENFGISFIVKDERIKIQCVSISNEDVGFENNPILITKEDAIKIAEEQNKKITDNKIVYTAATIQIRQMNAFIYAQEKSGGVETTLKKELDKNGIEKAYQEYAIWDDTARKVWAVKFDYEIGEPDLSNEYKYWSRLYFVDTTTGEIIGGSWGKRGDDMT